MFRSTAKGIAKNLSIMSLQLAITWSSSFLLMLFLPRYLGPIEYGRLYLAATISGMFQILVSYGGNHLITKSVSRAPEETGQILVDALALRLILAAVSIIAIVVLTYVLDYGNDVRTIIVVYSLGLLFWSGITTLYAGYQGKELLKYTSIGAVAEKVFVSALGIPLVVLGAKATALSVVVVVSFLLNFSVLIAYRNRIISSLPRVNWRKAIGQLHEGLPYFLFTVFGVIYYRIDSLMLSKMTPEAIVGYYGSAYRFFETLNFPYIVTVAIYPVLSRLWNEEREIHKRTTQKSLEYVILGGVPVGIAVIAFARDIIGLFYGLPEYGPSIILLQLLGAGLPLLYVSMILGTALMASDKQRELMTISLFAIPLNIGLNLVMIPHFQHAMANGAVGAAIATGFTELCVMAASFVLLPRESLQGFRTSVIPKILLGGLLMSAVIWGTGIFGVPWVVCAILGLTTYACTIFFSKTLEPVENQMILKALTVKGFLTFVRPSGRGTGVEQTTEP